MYMWLSGEGIKSLLWPGRKDLLFKEIKRRLGKQKSNLIDTKNKI